MHETFAILRAASADERPCVYCRLVETRGSTPQKAGAIMLVFADGSQAGTLGGGCVEAEVKRRALALLPAGKAEICTFTLDHDYGWDDGLICGGRMQVLLDPQTGRSQAHGAYYEQLTALAIRGKGFTECVAYAAGDFPPPAIPASCLCDETGNFLTGWNVSAEQRPVISAHLRSLAGRPRPYAQGGIAYLPVLSRCPLVIVGGGHVGQAVAKLAAELEFDITVVDDREEIVSLERFPTAQQRLAGRWEELLPQLTITPDTYCLIVTRGHSHDQEALFHLANRGARYVGMIGSRRKIKLIFDALLETGIPAAALQQVYAPLGIEIGSQTVPEIAVSICAELIAHRNCGGVVPGRPPGVWEAGGSRGA